MEILDLSFPVLHPSHLSPPLEPSDDLKFVSKIWARHLLRWQGKALKAKSYTSWEIAAHRLALLRIKQ